MGSAGWREVEGWLRERPAGWWKAVGTVLPEVAALEGVPQDPRHHAEGDVAAHTRRAVEALGPGADPDLWWAVLLHDVGKAVTTRREGERVTAHGHDVVGAEIAARMLERLGFSAERRERVGWLVRHHLFHASWGLARGDRASGRQRRLVADPRFPLLLELLRADAAASLGSPKAEGVYELYRELRATVTAPPLARPKEVEMATAMIISVGGTPEPIVRTLVEHRPEFVCFFGSEETIERVGEIKRLAAEAGVEVRNRNVMARDPQDLVACYRDALEAAGRLEEAGVVPEQVVVDYTGGTKTMSAALALATVGKGYRFSYVGGRERTKQGLGVVVSGTEEVRTGVSPWQLFAVEEKRAFASLFNRHLFASAEEVLARAVRHAAEEKDLLEALARLARGYRQWDAFRHAEAKVEVAAGVAGLGTWVRFRPDSGLETALAAAEQSLIFLNRLQEGTRGFKRRHRLQAADLLSNARRRAEVGRHDDAVARVYRALELVGQIAFEDTFGCDTGAADPKRLPEELRAEYAACYAGRDGQTLQLPLFATFRALEVAGRPEGRAFAARREELDKLLYARNHSILAHGFEPVAPDLPERFEGLVREAFGVGEVVVFPTFGF